MIGVVAYLALTVTIPALVLGHQGQDWPLPLRGAWQALRAPQGVFRDSRDAGTPPEPAQRRTGPRVPSWANTQPIKEN